MTSFNSQYNNANNTTNINPSKLTQQHNNTSSLPKQNSIFHSPSLENSHVSDTHEPITTTTSYTPTCCFNSFKLTPPFDSAMALTVLVLLTALFFMGFFSIYIRRFSHENTANPTLRRGLAVRKSGKKGVDPTVMESLPVYTYTSGDVEEGVTQRECVICLSEFEERECVKEIPYCGHVFHVTCLDIWLSRHVTCPLCRTAEFFTEEVKKAVKDESGHVVGGDERERGGRNTWQEVGLGSVRRSSSWSWCGERLTLERSLSF